jgi:hypothetical protein
MTERMASAQRLVSFRTLRAVSRAGRLRRLRSAQVVFALALSAFAGSTRAQEAAGSAGESRLRLHVGEMLTLGPGLVAPVRCDDPTLVEPVATERGLALVGKRVGSTHCSALTAAYTYQRYRVQVVPAEEAPAPG